MGLDVKWMDGFDQYGDPDFYVNEPGLWTGGIGTSNTLVTGRGGVGLAVKNNWRNDRIQTRQLGIADEFTIGFWLDLSDSGLPTSVKHIGSFKSPDGTHNCSLRVQNTGALELWLGLTTSKQSICSTLLIGGGQYVEVSITLHDTTGEVHWQIDGAAAGSDTGLDTLGGTQAQLDVVAMFDPTTVQCIQGMILDDMWIAEYDGVGSRFLGDCQVNTEMAASEAGTIQFTPSSGTDNALMVDEIGPDDDTTYNESNTVGHQDKLDVDDLAATGDTIHALQPFAYAKKTSAGAREIGVGVDSSAVEGGNTAQALSTTYKYYAEVVDQDPNTAAAWGVSGANAAELLYEVKS